MITIPSHILEGMPQLDYLYVRKGKWYHPDECWCYEFGPFATYDAAMKHFNNYCKWLNRS